MVRIGGQPLGFGECGHGGRVPPVPPPLGLCHRGHRSPWDPFSPRRVWHRGADRGAAGCRRHFSLLHQHLQLRSRPGEPLRPPGTRRPGVSPGLTPLSPAGPRGGHRRGHPAAAAAPGQWQIAAAVPTPGGPGQWHGGVPCYPPPHSLFFNFEAPAVWRRAGCSVTPCLLGTWAMVASGTQWPSDGGTVSYGRASCPGHATPWGPPKGSTCHPLSPREGSRCPQGPAGWGTCQRAVMCHHGAGVTARGWQGMSPRPVCVPMGDPFEWGCDALGPPWPHGA